MKLNKLLFSLLVFCSFRCFAQDEWSMEFVQETDSLLFTYQPGTEVKGLVEDFYFPSFYPWVNSKKKSLKAVPSKMGSRILECIIAVKDRSLTYKISNEEQRFSINGTIPNVDLSFYAKDLDSVKLTAKLSNGELVKVRVFQLDKSLSFQRLRTFFLKIPLQTYVKPIPYDLQVTNLILEGYTSLINKGELIVGDLSLTAFKRDTIVSNYREDYLSEHAPSIQSGNSGIYLQTPSLFKKYGSNLNNLDNLKLLNYGNSNDKIKEIQYVSTFIEKFLINYPYYKDGISSKEKVAENRTLSNNSKTLNEYYKGLKKLLLEIHDTHFKLEIKSQVEKATASPILFFNDANNRVKVGAVLDSLLLNKVFEDDVLLKVNGVDINLLMDEFDTDVSGSTKPQRKSKIVQSFLSMCKTKFGKNLNLALSRDGIPKDVPVILKDNFKPNFLKKGLKPISKFDFSKIGDIAYLKINFDFTQTVSFFYSHFQEIKSSKGLVIDLRGVTGSDFAHSSVLPYLISKPIDIATFPIVQPFNFFNTPYDLTETIFPEKNSFNGPIVLLIDSRTTCGAEIFIDAIQRSNENATVIGAEGTAGSVQLTRQILLPSEPSDEVLLTFFGKPSLVGSRDFDREGGIVPDIYVPINSFIQTPYYEDKVKQLALQFMERKFAQ